MRENDLIAQIVRWGQHIIDLLSPRRAIMLVIIASGLLYEATVAGGYGHGSIPLWRGFLAAMAGIASFACLWLATRERLPERAKTLWESLPSFFRWRGWRAAIVVYLLWVPWWSFSSQLPNVVRGDYHNDAIAYVHADADLIRAGKNPFTTDDAFWAASARWPQTGATPLLGSPLFGNDPLNYPSTQAQANALRTQRDDITKRNADFDPRTVHNYPAGIVLLALPLVWAGIPSVIWVNFLALAALIMIILSTTRKNDRAAVVIALVASPVVLLYTLLENFDVASIVFVLAAWQLMSRSRVSPLLLGLACAVKQIAWFFVPFYLIEVARREGWQAAARRGGWLAIGFTVPNLPFVIASPGAWLASILVPLRDPFFPIGYGLMSLGLGGILPLVPTLWSALEALVFIGLLVFQWRRREVTSDGLLFALIPLWFAWRSPMNYFAFLPLLALWLVLSRGAAVPHDQPTHPGRVITMAE